ncbi:DNA translocase FtsK 4TM domain-containing protein [Candidatus Microgenomates bacterium]|nr:DNA translocase FtsK 4TM domain-containing protein [Candidatus Microgenomates bacterium]
MPKKKNQQVKKSKTKPSKKSKQEELELAISPDTMAEIIAIVFVLVGGILGLSLFDLFGSFGQYIGEIAKQIFGWSSYLFSLSLLIFGILMFFPGRYPVKATTYVGFAMVNLLVPMFIHLFVQADFSFDTALDGAGGGFVGHFLGQGLKSYVDMSGSIVIIGGLFLIACLMLFNTSLRRIQEQMDSDPYKISIDPPKALGKLKINIPSPSLKEKFSGAIKGAVNKAEGVEEKSIKTSESAEEKNTEETIVKENFSWEYPPLSLLEESKYSVDSGNVTGNAETIAKTLAQFGIRVAMQDVNVGPTFTQYTLKPAEGTKLSKITTLQDDLALALATHPIRIEAPIPGKSLVGVEVPNKKVAQVRLKEILQSGEYRSAADRGNLVVSLGKDVSGVPAVADIARMPHILIAGATGSGKSVCVNGILASLLFRYSPKELRLIMVDPKRVEMTGYNDIAHLLTPVITEPDKTINAFRWAVGEMENRYKLLSSVGARDIVGYNKKLGKNEESMPYIVLVVDELADVMIQAAQEMEGLIVRIAQMARAVGIHLILATQRPSVNVVTGLIKANVPSRVAFRVASQVDSRTILDMAGAERLIGRGDMLFMAGDGQKPKRIQGVFVDDKEIKSIIDKIKAQQEPEYNEDVIKPHKAPGMAGGAMAGEIDDDMYQQAYDEVVRSGKASASFLQRRLRIGYARAARLLDILEEQGVIASADGSKPREVIVSRADNTAPTEIYDDDWGDENEEA